MNGIIQQIALVASQADESDEERAQRLEGIAAESDATATTLYQIEEDLRGLGWSVLAQNDANAREIESQLKQFAPMLGLDPERAEEQFGADTAIKLATQHALENPKATAHAVATVHDVLDRRGLYDELDVTVPAPGEYVEEGR